MTMKPLTLKHPWLGLLLALLLGSATPGSAADLSSAELLERAIYAEETIGDLDSAIEIYRRVLDDEAANRPFIAQAHFRLGLCYLKRGEQDLARAAFETLVRDFPAQDPLVEAAREELSALSVAPQAISPPWHDGERLTYSISLPNGRELGFLQSTTRSQIVDGVEAWHVETRRFIHSGSSDYAVSRVSIAKESQRPLRSSFRSRALAFADAVYGADSVTIVAEAGAGERARETVIERTADVYDNEQATALMRTLPLEPGFERQLRLLPIWTEAILDAQLTVTGREACEVPAGRFTCDVVKLDLGDQTYWITTGAERHVVRFKAGGAVVELVEVEQVGADGRASYGIEDFDFTGSLPAGWLSHNFQPRKGKGVIRFLDPDASTLSSAEIDLCPKRGCPGLEEMARHELAGAEKRFTDYALRPETWRQRTIDGRPAISFVGDFDHDGEAWVQYRVYTFTDDKRFEFIFRLPAERFEAFQSQADSIFESLEAR